MLYELDFNDAESLKKFAVKTVELAENYQMARENYANALKTLKVELAKAYSEGRIKESLSEDKAYIMLSNESEDMKMALENVIMGEQTYKGLEKVLSAREAIVTLYQSILKNLPK